MLPLLFELPSVSCFPWIESCLCNIVTPNYCLSLVSLYFLHNHPLIRGCYTKSGFLTLHLVRIFIPFTVMFQRHVLDQALLHCGLVPPNFLPLNHSYVSIPTGKSLLHGSQTWTKVRQKRSLSPMWNNISPEVGHCSSQASRTCRTRALRKGACLAGYSYTFYFFAICSASLDLISHLSIFMQSK